MHPRVRTFHHGNRWNNPTSELGLAAIPKKRQKMHKTNQKPPVPNLYIPSLYRMVNLKQNQKKGKREQPS